MVRVAYLTVVFRDDIGDKAAHHLTDEIAGEAMAFPAVTAVKCDVGVLEGDSEQEFWREADGNEGNAPARDSQP